MLGEYSFLISNDKVLHEPYNKLSKRFRELAIFGGKHFYAPQAQTALRGIHGRQRAYHHSSVSFFLCCESFFCWYFSRSRLLCCSLIY